MNVLIRSAISAAILAARFVAEGFATSHSKQPNRWGSAQGWTKVEKICERPEAIIVMTCIAGRTRC